MDMPRDPTLRLYPAQMEGVRRFVEKRPRRMLLAYGTGCGKTPTALRALEAAGVIKGRVLVVCPAMVRRHWAREADRWLGVDMHPIEHGRKRRLPKATGETRDAAYAAQWSVVSYDLLRQCDAQGYSAVILDEVHHIAHWASGQSTTVRSLMAANPRAAVLGLSATLIPTEVKQLWHPLLALFGKSAWGALPRSGQVNWEFANRYCHVENNGYGWTVSGGKNLEELKTRLGRIAHRVTREDIAADMPPLNVRMLDLSGTALSDEGRPNHDALFRHSLTWVQELPEDIHHAVVLFYHRERAHDLVKNLEVLGIPHLHIDGTYSTKKRAELLDEAMLMPRCVLVATSESIREGVRLMWAQKVLLAEWRQSPVQVIQVLGRFQSVGSTAKPEVEILTDESLYGAARILLRRTRAINDVLTAGRVEKVVQEVFTPKDLTEARLGELTRAMLTAHTNAMGREDWNDDDGEEW